MWYKSHSRYYYIDDNDKVYTVWPDGKWEHCTISTIGTNRIVAVCQRIDMPEFGSKVLREINNLK